MSKQMLRKQARARRDAVPVGQRADWSAAICRRAVELAVYRVARVVHCYLPIQSEVDTRPLVEHALARGKRVAMPVFVRGSDETPCAEITSLSEDEFEIGGFGLRAPRVIRPVALNEIDLVFVPLLIFAPAARVEGREWGRLGYGAGYYDRLLGRLRAARIGLAFGMQRADELPITPRDALLDAVVTEYGSIRRLPC